MSQYCTYTDSEFRDAGDYDLDVLVLYDLPRLFRTHNSQFLVKPHRSYVFIAQIHAGAPREQILPPNVRSWLRPPSFFSFYARADSELAELEHAPPRFGNDRTSERGVLKIAQRLDPLFQTLPLQHCRTALWPWPVVRRCWIGVLVW